MKVLLVQDVYKLGRAGDVKKVADGYGRNYLIPQGLAILATPGALKQADRIRSTAETKRNQDNKELGGLAKQLSDLRLVFPVKAGETGKLYGSVTNQMIMDEVNKKLNIELERRHIDAQPIRTLGVHRVNVRLTIDLVPEVLVLVYREGESPESAYAYSEAEFEAVPEVPTGESIEEKTSKAKPAAELEEAAEESIEEETPEAEPAAEFEEATEEPEEA